jgi:hypothetical protein
VQAPGCGNFTGRADAPIEGTLAELKGRPANSRARMQRAGHQDVWRMSGASIDAYTRQA